MINSSVGAGKHGALVKSQIEENNKRINKEIKKHDQLRTKSIWSTFIFLFNKNFLRSGCSLWLWLFYCMYSIYRVSFARCCCFMPFHHISSLFSNRSKSQYIRTSRIRPIHVSLSHSVSARVCVCACVLCTCRCRCCCHYHILISNDANSN